MYITFAEKRKVVVTLIRATTSRFCGEFITNFNKVFVDFVTRVLRRGN